MKAEEFSFIDTDAESIKTNLIIIYESLTNRTLAQGDPVRLFLNSVAAIIVQQREIINFTGKMNLLPYSEGKYLEPLGELVGTPRLAASAAQATAKIVLSEKQAGAVIVPKGTRITAGDGIFFQTEQQTILVPGEIEKETAVKCLTAGSAGNGYLPGQLKTIVDPVAYVTSITNTTETNGGTDIEGDESYRERIHEAPESFSCAGPEGAYLYFAKSASQLIADVAVLSPAPGEVEILPLVVGGEIPSAELLAKIAAACNDKKVRPLTDHVHVLAPSAIPFDIDVTYYIESSDAANAARIESKVKEAIEGYVLWQKSKLGRDINPSELITRVVNAGAKRVNIASPQFKEISKRQVAVAQTVAVTLGGIEDD